MKLRTLIISMSLAMGLAVAMAPVSKAHDGNNHKVKLLAGSPGYDHIQPFMAKLKGWWKKYNVDVNFIGGNYVRANQQISIGDFDVGYLQIASSIRYNAAGIPSVIVAASSANCALMVGAPNIKSIKQIPKGSRIGIVTKFDAQYLTLTKHILPRFGLSEKDVQLARIPVPETASAMLTGDVAAAFPFEPFGTYAISKGATLLLSAKDMIDKNVIASDMLRNAMVMNTKFVKEHPELAKRLVWAHLDAVHIMRTDKEDGMKTLKHYNKKISLDIMAKAYDNCGWDYNEPPKVWINTLIKWMNDEKLLKKQVGYDDVVDMSMAKTYPGYPAWEKIK